MLDLLQRWLGHMVWADRLTLDSLRKSGGLPAQALEIYAHALGAEHVWLSRLRESPPETAVWPELDLDGCAVLASRNATDLQELLAGLQPADLERRVAYRNSAGLEFQSRVADMLSQVFLHGSYHRGQVAMLLRGAGFAPIGTDYIGFVRGTPAATRTRE